MVASTDLQQGVPMPIMVVQHTPTLTQERYEYVVRGLTGGKPRLESPADVPTRGLLVHVAAQTERGFMIFDVFETRDAFDRFRTVATPFANEAGIEQPPEGYPAHTFISV
jgi:hypothetical protein